MVRVLIVFREYVVECDEVYTEERFIFLFSRYCDIIFFKGGGGWNEFIKGGGLLNVQFFEFNEKISDDLNFFCKYL